MILVLTQPPIVSFDGLSESTAIMFLN